MAMHKGLYLIFQLVYLLRHKGGAQIFTKCINSQEQAVYISQYHV